MKWNKIGQIFNPTIWDDGIDRPWMRTHSQCTHSLILKDVVRIFFSCRPTNENGWAKSYTTYIDLDKNDLTKIIRLSDKPVMSLGKIGCFDEFAVYPTSNIEYNGKLYLYYAGWTRCLSVPFNTSIGLAISTNNGESFERISDGPILSASIDEPFVISGPKIRRFKYQIKLTKMNAKQVRMFFLKIIYIICISYTEKGLILEIKKVEDIK